MCVRVCNNWKLSFLNLYSDFVADDLRTIMRVCIHTQAYNFYIFFEKPSTSFDICVCAWITRFCIALSEAIKDY